MKTIAFLFPGQGSQKPGMGEDVYREFFAARDVFETAETATGLPIRSICFEGSTQELTATVYQQPAVTTLNLALLNCIFSSGIRPSICAGHSLGEYSALAAAGVLSVHDCIKLVHKRGELMQREAVRTKGAMKAVIGLDITRVSKIISSAAQKGPVSIANHNSADQVVITGAPEEVDTAGILAESEGARVIPLRVNGAWHSPLINGALESFQEYLSGIRFNPPRCRVFHNVTAAEEYNPFLIKKLMSLQFCTRVRWHEIMLKMIDNGVDAYVEIGPGSVLTNLLKRTLPENSRCRIYNVSGAKTLKAFLEAEA